jgi:hypothetical protein
MIHGNLGDTLVALGEQENGTKRLEEAVEAYRAALAGLTPMAPTGSHEMAQTRLSHANALLAERRNT